jgi:hypothetical protein
MIYGIEQKKDKVCICKQMNVHITHTITGIGFTLYDYRVQGKIEISGKADLISTNFGCFCGPEHVSLL